MQLSDHEVATIEVREMASSTEEKKVAKYYNLHLANTFASVATKTLGTIGASLMSFVKELDH